MWKLTPRKVGFKFGSFKAWNFSKGSKPFKGKGLDGAESVAVLFSVGKS